MGRGRAARRPTQIPASGWLDIGARVWKRIGEDQLSLVSAGVAFFGLLAIFPAITAILAIAGLILDRETVVAELESLRGVVPGDVLEIMTEQATSVATSQELELALLVSVGLALWSASRGVNVLCDGLNVVYDEDEARGFVAKNLQVLGLTALIILGVVLGLAAILGIPVLLAFLDLGTVSEAITRIGRWVVLAGMTIAGLSILYRFGPSRANPKWNWVSYGAVLACILWVAASGAFTVYVENFADYNKSFGAIAGVIILMMWMWISVFVVLIGAKVNAEMEHQTSIDTTTGAPAPMGERGAVKADTLGPARDA
ncbi:YihY/virulence factor BrkB family protein [Aliishimia ponticola]|uniref:YihY/virulence factor BrkB family protein n=1 Tax=Aliishimia ponticola TaxID=2499833 RepID=A0A4S4NLI9_9RHOB|nr:YihY/virulence factor BrkB family protein [Aliishimia ponticola]